MKYKRVLLKLRGESLMGEQSYGISPKMLEQYGADIKSAVKAGLELAIVIGGGNIFRGLSGVAQGFDRVQGDYMGMLATLINSMALQSELERQGLRTELLSGYVTPSSGRGYARWQGCDNRWGQRKPVFHH